MNKDVVITITGPIGSGRGLLVQALTKYLSDHKIKTENHYDMGEYNKYFVRIKESTANTFSKLPR